MVPFPNIVRAAIRFHALDDPRDHDVRVGIAVAMRVGGQIVGNRKPPTPKNCAMGSPWSPATPERNIAEP